MGRIRTIKPEFFKHEQLFDAERESGLPLRLAYAGLWTQADRAGRFAWRPRQLKTDVLPYDDVDFERVLDMLVTHGCLEKYAVEGVRYGRIRSFAKHQVINNKERASELPFSPEEQTACQPNACVTGEQRAEYATATRAAGVVATISMQTDDDPAHESTAPVLSEELKNSSSNTCATRAVREDHATTPREIHADHAPSTPLLLFQVERERNGKGKEHGSGSDASADASAAASDFQTFFLLLRGIFATLYEKNYGKKYPGDPHDRPTAENVWEKLRAKSDREQWITNCLAELFARESKPRTLYYCEAKLIDDYEKAAKAAAVKQIRTQDPGLIRKLRDFLTDTQIDALLMRHSADAVGRAYRKLCGYGLKTEAFRERFYQQLSI